MLEGLAKYKESGMFVFKPEDRLAAVCKGIPNDKSGVYVVYAISGKKKEVVYIGRTGQILYGYPKHRKGGLRGHLVTGKHQLGYPVMNVRQISWPKKMKDDGIDSLEVQWFVTLDESTNDCPMILEKDLLAEYKKSEGDLPAWNKLS